MTNEQIETALKRGVDAWMGRLAPAYQRPESFQYVRASILTTLNDQGVPIDQHTVDTALREAKYPGYDWQA